MLKEGEQQIGRVWSVHVILYSWKKPCRYCLVGPVRLSLGNPHGGPGAGQP
jgi:hypothetical protein